MPLKRLVSGKRGNTHRRQQGRNTRKATHRRQGTLAAAMTGTVLILLLCLFLPGLLLHMDSQREVGKILQADQLYYADNVSTADTVGFDLSKRLMMKSGRWKSEKTQIMPEDVPKSDTILSEEDMRLLGGAVFVLLAEKLWNSDYMVDALESFDEVGRVYIERMRDGGYEGMASSSSCKLYKYADKVLDSYYFYMWEYTYEMDGIRFCLEVDAVTLEFYSVSAHGTLFDNLPWMDAMNLCLSYRRDELDVYSKVVMESGLGSLLFDSAFTPTMVIPAFASAYWIAGIMEGECENELASFTHPDEMLTTAQKGYSFREGNFMIKSRVQCFLEDASDWVTIRNDDGDTVYAYIDFADGGFDWYMAPERPRPGSKNAEIPYDPLNEYRETQVLIDD